KYRVSAITPNLLIGDIISSASIALLMRHSVTAIVSLTRYRNEEWDRPANRVLIPQALHLHVPILDSPNEDILSHLPTICDFIDLHLSKPITTTTTAFSSSSTTTQHHPSDSRVLVHCHIGKSRSPTAVAAYLMRSQGLSVEEALRVIKAGREIAEPNAGFLKQLHLWEELKYELYEDPAKGALPKEAYEKHLKEIAKEKNAMYDALIKSDMDRMLDLRSRSSQTSSSVGR
ncbi:protein-tyrosine phosphatase-like protein, partial [Podospora conica]